MVVLVIDQQAVGVAHLDLDAFGGLLRGRAPHGDSDGDVVTVGAERREQGAVVDAL